MKRKAAGKLTHGEHNQLVNKLIGVVTGIKADLKQIMENHGVPASLVKRRLEIIPEAQSGVDKRVLDLVQQHRIDSLDKLTPENSKLQLVKDFVDAIVTQRSQKSTTRNML